MFAMLAVVHVRVTAASHPSISAHAVMGEWAGPASALLCKGQRSLIKFVCLCIECRVGVVRTRGLEQLAPPEDDPLMAARGFWIGILFAIAEQCWFAQYASLLASTSCVRVPGRRQCSGCWWCFRRQGVGVSFSDLALMAESLGHNSL